MGFSPINFCSIQGLFLIILPECYNCWNSEKMSSQTTLSERCLTCRHF